jgi:pilus assembly protein CpaE
MLHCILICPNEDANAQLAVLLSRIPDLEVVRVMTTYPSPDELLRAIRVRKADLLLLCIDEWSQSEAIINGLDNTVPGLPVITFDGHDSPELLPKLMHLGVREHLNFPLDASALASAVDRARRRLVTHPVAAARQSDLYTFLPAKPGVGTSTLAVSASHALAEDFGARTLLLDCDLAAGAIRFLLKLATSGSVVDSIKHAGNLDEDMWSQMVGKCDRLEVLHAGLLEPPAGLDLPSLERVLAMARSQYEVICVDLASSMDEFSVALMKESRRIFLVTTPEVVPLHMAKARLASLKDLGLQDRVSLLLNRKVRNDFSDVDVAELVGLPVAFSFSNDYAGVQGAILNAAPVPHESALGQSILNLAHSMAPHLDVPKPQSYRRKFLQFFRQLPTHEQELVSRT